MAFVPCGIVQQVRPCAAVAACVTALTACGEGGMGEWTGTMRDSAGIVIVENSDRGVWGRGTGWRVGEDLRIGAVAGDPDYEFGVIADMEVDDAGRIYVLDSQAQSIRVYGPDGRFLRSFGRSGAGPGELSASAHAILLAADTLFVPDLRHQRVSKYTTDGKPAGSFAIAAGPRLPIHWEVTADGELVFQLVPIAMGGADRQPGAPIVLRPRDGGPPQTLIEMPGSFLFGDRPGEFMIMARAPVWTLAPDDHLITGHTDAYRFEVYNRDGALTRVIRKVHTPRQLTAEDQAKIRRALRTAFEQQGTPPAAVDRIVGQIRIAETLPAINTRILADPQGHLWVQQTEIPDPERIASTGDPASVEPESPRWDVFDPEGRYLGVVLLPESFRLRRIVGDALYGVTRNELDVPYVTRLRISRF